MNDLFHVKQFLKYTYIYQSFFALTSEMFILWLETCDDAATDNCYCKKRGDLFSLNL